MERAKRNVGADDNSSLSRDKKQTAIMATDPFPTTTPTRHEEEDLPHHHYYDDEEEEEMKSPPLSFDDQFSVQINGGSSKNKNNESKQRGSRDGLKRIVTSALPVKVSRGGGTQAQHASSSTSVQQHDDDDSFVIQNDIYSLLFISPIHMCSHVFWYCVFFLLFQAAVIVLIAADLLSDGTPDNWLAIPHGVGTIVSVSQVFCLFIAVLTQQDVVTSLYLASVGYHPIHVPPEASRGKWIFCNVLLRFVLGMSIIFLCFVFIVQSTNVIDLYKDFAAVTFIADIDDAAFVLAKMGFVSDTLRQTTRQLQTVRLSERDDSLSLRGRGHKNAATWSRCRFRQLFLVAVFVVMLGYWASLYQQQRNGEFTSDTLTVQFGDDVYESLQYAFFSGIYERAKGETIAQRPVYYERGYTVSNGQSGRFFYCIEEEAWVFSIANITKSEERDDSCNWLMKSSKTNSFDLEEVPDLGWKVWTGRVETARYLRIVSDDCNADSDCNYHGSCLPDGRCQCDPGWLGEECRFEDSLCERLVFYLEDRAVQNFTLLLDNDGHILTAYGRPVFYSESILDSTYIIVILYTGRRWFVTRWEEEKLPSIEQVRSALASPFFHAYWRDVYRKQTVLFSEPTESIMPVSEAIKWEVLGASKSRGDFGAFGFWKSIQFASMHCEQVDCSIPLVCGVNGICRNSTCICQNNATGHFCQYPFAPEITAIKATANSSSRALATHHSEL